MHEKTNGFDKLMKKQIYSTLPILIVLLLVITFTTVSFAWLLSFKEIAPDISFTGGSVDEYLLYQITCENDSTVLDVVEVDGIGKSGFLADDLQFGKISNLGMLENSNFIYYCIRVPKTDGQSISLGVSYHTSDGSHFKIYVPERDEKGELVYDENGVLSTSLLEDKNVLDAIKGIEEDNSDTFIKYRAVASSIAPGEISSISALDAMFEDDAKDLNPDEDGNVVYTSMTYDTSSLESDYYYMYIKLEPNVQLYPDFIEYLWHSMPFGLCYDLKISFNVTP